MVEFEDKDKGWKNIDRRRQRLASYEIAVGILGNKAITPHKSLSGNRESDSELTMVEIAVVNEYGSDDGRIPERGANREAFEQNKEELMRRMAVNVRLVDESRLQPKKSMDLIGLWYADQVKNTIRDFDDPPNAESTQEKKGKHVGPGVMVDNPLIDTGRYINSVMHETRTKGSENDPTDDNS